MGQNIVIDTQNRSEDLSFKTVIPDRYTDQLKSKRYKYKYINVYEIYHDHVKLLIVDRLTERTKHTILIEKADFDRVSEHHWGGAKGNRPPCSRIDKKCVTIGIFISGSEFRICGKVKGSPLWNLLHDQYSSTGNAYTSLENEIMKLEIFRRDSPPYTVIYDKEDHLLVSNYIWRVEKDNRGTFSVISRDNNKQISMHRHILEAHGNNPGNKGFKNLKCIDYRFDLRKSTLNEKHALNIYSIIDSEKMELTINSVHGIVKAVFDRKDYEKVSTVGWGYKKHNLKLEIRSYKYGQLKRYILGTIDQNYRYIIEKKDASGRFDYRRETLMNCLR